MRDLCLKIGVKLLSHSNKEYLLDNDLSSSQKQQSVSASAKKRTATAAIQAIPELVGYECLPF